MEKSEDRKITWLTPRDFHILRTLFFQVLASTWRNCRSENVS